VHRPLTLIGFLQTTGSDIHIYDMGRRINQIPIDCFYDFEEGRAPWPQPLQRQAWFATLFRPAGETEPLIWFLRLPLDEQGKLVPASRDELLQYLLEEGLDDSKSEGSGAQNSYSFRPRDDRLAVFHAQASAALGQPPSHYYAHARQYFSGELGWDQWTFVGLQGIADIAARLDEPTIEELAKAVPSLPTEPFVALCQCLENSPLPAPLAQAIEQRLERNLAGKGTAIKETVATIRGIALSEDAQLARRLLRRVLENGISSHPEILAAISARAWEHLLDDGLRKRFLERLATNSAGQAFFDQCLADLLFLPGMRFPFLESLRNSERSPTLEEAIGRFFHHLTG